jgi:gamma-glutamyltranspeptidase / glutathione hydrolase
MANLRRNFHFDELVTSDGMCTAPDPAVAEAGAKILRSGGNAVDAAVAATFAEGVVEPWSSGVGGSATMTIALRDPDRLVCVEGHMVAPAGVSNDLYPLAAEDKTRIGRLGVFDWPKVSGHVNLYGGRSVGIPGFVAALCTAHEVFGRLPLSEVLAPAVRLAADGCDINYFTGGFLTGDAKSLMRDEGCASVFLPRGLPLRGPTSLLPDRLVQAALARTLEAIGGNGPKAFYEGEIASSMAACVRAKGGGVLTVEDLAGYHASVFEPPLVGRYGRFDIAGAPKAGLATVLQALNLYDAQVRDEGVPEGEGPHDDPVAWARALFLAFTDRLRYMTTDPSVQIPWAGLRSRSYARALLAAEGDGTEAPDPASFSGEDATAAGVPGRPASGGFTSHVTTADRHGNLVSVTGTVLNSWGARLLDPATGVLFNNGMGYFDPRPGVRNGIYPGRMVLSAMTPVILSEDGRGPMCAVGASGGPRIISGVAQIIAALATGRVSLQEAIEEPRIHAETREVMLDTRWPDAASEALTSAGFTVNPTEELPTSGNFARPNGIIIDPDGRRRSGVDPIRPGDAAAG